MQLDFHYDVTYIASLIAGFDKNDAKTIAWAAQYVDDVISVETKSVKLHTGSQYTFTPILTAADLSPLHPLYKWFSEHAVKTVYADKHRQIWVTYHFPPGNFVAYRKGGDTEPRAGHILRQFRGGGTEREENELVKKHLPLICRPNSDLVREMITDTRLQYQRYLGRGEKNIALNFLGIRMHVYADTWAHQDHLGAPDRSFNRVESFEEQMEKGGWNGEKYQFTKEKYKDGSMGGSQGVALGYRSNVMWLGHGPMGNWPDLPYAVYRWRPRYQDGKLVRNNPEEFLQAFANLVHALSYVQGATPKKKVGTKTLRSAPVYEPVIGDYDKNIGNLKAEHIAACKEAIKNMRLSPDKNPVKRMPVWEAAFTDTSKIKENKAGKEVVPPYDPLLAENELKKIRKGWVGNRYYEAEEFFRTRFYR